MFTRSPTPTLAIALGILAAALGPLLVDEASATSAVARLPTPRLGTTAIWDGTHSYVFGGHQGGPGPSSGDRLRQIVRHDPVSDTVQVMGGMLPSGRYSASAVWTGTHAFLFGGQGTSILHEIVRYDPATDTVTTMPTTLPSGRTFTSAVWDGTHAYVFGGHDASFRLTDEIVRYTPGTGAVVVLDAKLPTPRTTTSAVWDGENAYVFGGFAGLASLDEIVRFTPATGEVSTLGIRLPTSREFTSAVWTGSEAYILGGRTLEGSRQTNLGEVLRFDPSTETLSVRTATLPTPRYHTSAVWDGSEAYVFGGYGGGGRLDEVVRIGGDPPAPPAGLVAAPDLGMTRLAWVPPGYEGDAPVSSYHVFRGTSGAADTFLAEVAGDVLSYTDGTCRVGLECTYAVLAVNTHGASAPSDRVTARGLQPCFAHNPSATANACLTTKGDTPFTRPHAEVETPRFDPDGGPCLVGDVCVPVAGGATVGEREDAVPYGLSGYAEATALCTRAPAACRVMLP